ncbi:MAG: endo-1,4-beta-xylanase [Chloroflexi bacterium]|nr:endo-1,4-beta-xylanase [Chloroflexota bacterium]
MALLLGEACGTQAKDTPPATAVPASTATPVATPASASPPSTSSVAPSVEPASPPPLLPTPTLRELADRAHVTIGSQVVTYGLDSSDRYRRAAPEIANLLAIDGELDIRRVFSGLDWRTIPQHWPEVSAALSAGRIPYEDQLNFSAADALIGFAERNGMRVHAQHLLWPQDMPTDLTAGAASPDAILKVVRFFVQARVLRYKGRIQSWSAVNEVAGGRLYGDARYKYWYGSPFSDELIRSVFEWAHAADPHAALLLNENNVVELDNPTYAPVAAGFIRLLSELKSGGVPVSVAGLENHLWIYDPPTLASMETLIREVHGLGLRAMATETTVAMSEHYPFWSGRPKRLPSVPNRLTAQANLYRNALQACIDTGSVFCMFGFTDAVSLFDSNNIHIPDAQGLILDANYSPKPAYFALLDVLKQKAGLG